MAIDNEQTGETSVAVPTIYLLRHGETVWNCVGRFQGQQDSPLTARGIEQADHVARLLRDALCTDDQPSGCRSVRSGACDRRTTVQQRFDRHSLTYMQ